MLYHEYYHTIEEAEDLLDIEPTDGHKLFEHLSPITLFVLNNQNDLEVIAIQKHYTSGKIDFPNSIFLQCGRKTENAVFFQKFRNSLVIGVLRTTTTSATDHLEEIAFSC